MFLTTSPHQMSVASISAHPHAGMRGDKQKWEKVGIGKERALRALNLLPTLSASHPTGIQLGGKLFNIPLPAGMLSAVKPRATL